MSATASGKTAHDAPELVSASPLDGSVVDRFPVAGGDEVAAAVRRARQAAAGWARSTPRARRRTLVAWRRYIAHHVDELVALVRRETGKPAGDAQLEILLALDHISWATKNADSVLRSRRVRSGLLMLNQCSRVEYRPLGVIGVIGPWNYPVFTPLGSIVYALAAGNAVVFKPSEHTPAVGDWLSRSFTESGGPRGLFTAIHGAGTTGEALCRAGVDKLAFTGSTATGKRVMAACAPTLTPVVIEAGGKDALLVDADADLDAAAVAAVWGAYSNAGQTCIGIERVYVHHVVAADLIARIRTLTAELVAGRDDAARLGPITMPGQVDVIRAHLQDALARGGEALVGGEGTIDGDLVQPTLLVNVPEDSPAVREETFGPLLVINPVADMADAIARTNATGYGLGGAVFARSHGREIAQAIRSGMTSINSVISFAAVPSLPFGGVGESGFGRIHGPDGLKEFSYAKATTRQVFPSLLLTSMTRTPRTDSLVSRLIDTLFR